MSSIATMDRQARSAIQYLATAEFAKLHAGVQAVLPGAPNPNDRQRDHDGHLAVCGTVRGKPVAQVFYYWEGPPARVVAAP